MGAVRDRPGGGAGESDGLAAAHQGSRVRPPWRGGQRRTRAGRVRPGAMDAGRAGTGQSCRADRAGLWAGVGEDGAAHAPGVPQAGVVGAGGPPRHAWPQWRRAAGRTGRDRGQGCAARTAGALEGHRQRVDAVGRAAPGRPAQGCGGDAVAGHVLPARPRARPPCGPSGHPGADGAGHRRRARVHPDRGIAARGNRYRSTPPAWTSSHCSRTGAWAGRSSPSL